MTTQNKYYDSFFASGGWKYDLNEHRRYLIDTLMPIVGWKKGDTLIEIGSGMGHHSELLRQQGLDVTAVEASSSGVEYARRRYPKLRAVCADASKWVPTDPVDHVYARGMSFFHYELNGLNRHGVDVPKETQRMFDLWLRPGGTFTLHIVTDFSGRKGSVHMNKLESYLSLFSAYGTVERATDFSGNELPVVKADRGIVIVTRKDP
jgi:trans-aconitate methyltransferase